MVVSNVGQGETQCVPEVMRVKMLAASFLLSEGPGHLPSSSSFYQAGLLLLYLQPDRRFLTTLIRSCDRRY